MHVEHDGEHEFFLDTKLTTRHRVRSRKMRGMTLMMANTTLTILGEIHIERKIILEVNVK